MFSLTSGRCVLFSDTYEQTVMVCLNKAVSHEAFTTSISKARPTA